MVWSTEEGRGWTWGAGSVKRESLRSGGSRAVGGLAEPMAQVGCAEHRGLCWDQKVMGDAHAGQGPWPVPLCCCPGCPVSTTQPARLVSTHESPGCGTADRQRLLTFGFFFGGGVLFVIFFQNIKVLRCSLNSCLPASTSF